MTQDDIIKMARKAGAERSCINDSVWMLAMAETSFEAFASLIAAAEREECAKLCDLLMEKARGSDPKRSLVFLTAEGLASEIRARGEEMTRDNSIKLAKEAGLDCAPDGYIYHPDTTDSAPLDVFVERLVNLAQAAEREECAKLCEEQRSHFASYFEINERLDECADAIRARGNK